MRTALFNLIIATFICMCTACMEKIPMTTLSISTTHSMLFAANNNADALIEINTNSDSWEYIAPEWVVATKGDKSLIVNVADNDGDVRTDSIIFTAGTAEAVVLPITQSAHIATAILNNLIEGDTHEITTDQWSCSLNAILTAPAINDVTIALSINHKYTYFDINGNRTPVVPDEAISFSQQELTIKDGSTLSDTTTVTVDATLLTPGITYALPVYGEIKSGNAEFAVNTKLAVYYIKRKGERTVKQIVYLEVNNCNPLNILEYNLADGTPFFDAVILFAANINYDSDNDIVYLHNNPNVQALLDNSDTYLQPLRERGIKVYLGILGNHDAAGLAQLSDWGAEQWAQSVAETCRTYKLDGVNLDDEYSKNPIVDNHWFTQHSAKAGARLAYELKKALSEKCDWPTEVSIFEYGALYDLPEVTIDGETHTQSEFIDIVLANYGSYAMPYGDLTYAQCSGASIELAQGRTLTERSAQNIIDKGYGWCMWFAFDPSGTGGAKNNLEHSMKQFNVAAEMFYNSQVVDPVHVYNKVGEGVFDPTPYTIK